MHLNALSHLSSKARVEISPIHGRGLFATGELLPGEIVCVKGGHIFTRSTLEKVTLILGPAEIQIGDDLFIGPIYPEQREGCMIFSNHSCDPNIGVQGQIVFVALRQIFAGEELTHDWATTDDDDYELLCRCGATTCRGTITGKDWQKEDLQQKYHGLFSSYLQQKIKASTLGTPSVTNASHTEERLKERELELLTPMIRQSPERLSSLLADDFREFGSSGQIFSKNDIIEALRTEPPVQISISDFRTRLLGDGVALVTYQALKREEANSREIVSLRSSLWVNSGGQWQMLFHQGTKVSKNRPTCPKGPKQRSRATRPRLQSAG